MKRNARILIVDDDPDWQDILNVLCVSIGHQPHVVGGFHEALTALRQTAFDLAIIDLGIDLRIDGAPNIEIGKTLVLHVRRDYSDIPVIVISGDAPPGWVRDAFLVWGVRDFVEKDTYDPGRMMEMIHRLLSKEGGGSLIVDSTLERLRDLQAKTVALANRMDEIDDELVSGPIDMDLVRNPPEGITGDLRAIIIEIRGDLAAILARLETMDESQREGFEEVILRIAMLPAKQDHQPLFDLADALVERRGEIAASVDAASQPAMQSRLDLLQEKTGQLSVATLASLIAQIIVTSGPAAVQTLVELGQRILPP